MRNFVALVNILESRWQVHAEHVTEPVGIRMHPASLETLARVVMPAPTRTGDWVFGGLTVYVDRWLPPGVWRLTAADGTLLYDSRQRRKGSEW